MIKSEAIKKYLYNIMSKDDDISNVRNLVLKGKDFRGNKVEYDFSDCGEIPNLTNCSLEFFDVGNELIDGLNLIKTLESLSIGHSKLNTTNRLRKMLKKLTIKYTEITNFDLFYDNDEIEELRLIDVGEVDLLNLIPFKKIKKLDIYDCNITNFRKIKEFSELKELKLAGSNLDNDEVLNELEENIKVQKYDSYLPMG